MRDLFGISIKYKHYVFNNFYSTILSNIYFYFVEMLIGTENDDNFNVNNILYFYFIG